MIDNPGSYESNHLSQVHSEAESYWVIHKWFQSKT